MIEFSYVLDVVGWRFNWLKGLGVNIWIGICWIFVEDLLYVGIGLEWMVLDIYGGGGGWLVILFLFGMYYFGCSWGVLLILL